MSESAFIFILVVAIPLVAVAIYLQWRKEQQRREALHALANQLGWRFSSQRDRDHDDDYTHFEIFRRGHSRYAFNTLTGSLLILDQHCPAKMGDFHYKVTSGSGKNRRTRTYRFSYLIVRLPFPDLPPLIIREEGFFDRVKGFFGYGAISFESEEFNRLFYVNGDDRKFAYDVIHPRMMEFLMETRPPTVDMEFGQLCLSAGRTRWSPDRFGHHLEWVSQFIERWPAHLKHQLQRETSAPWKA